MRLLRFTLKRFVAMALLLTAIIVAFAFVGDGLRDAFDPRGWR
jgi:ABC-type dipeptide/oligopeptide/nickel transport system permease subunit